MGTLIDTSVIIDFLRRPNKKECWFYTLSLKHSLAISIITHAELYSGKSIWKSSKNKKYLDTIISKLDIINLDIPISTLGGRIKSNLNTGLLDCIIAASAINNHLKLATLNTKDFQGIKNLKLLKSPY